MKTVMRLTINTAAFALGSIFGQPRGAQARATHRGARSRRSETVTGSGTANMRLFQECLPNVLAGNHPVTAIEPLLFAPSGYCLCSGQDPINTTSGAVEGRKPRKMQNNGHRDQICDLPQPELAVGSIFGASAGQCVRSSISAWAMPVGSCCRYRIARGVRGRT